MVKLKLLPPHDRKKMSKELIKKIINIVQNGLIFGNFTQEEFEEIKEFFNSTTPKIKPLPKLVDSQTAMSALQCDKHRLNYFMNQGFIKRVKFGHRKIMVDYDSLLRFMTYGV